MEGQPSIAPVSELELSGAGGDPSRAAVPRQAASVMLLRGGAAALEVLLLRRTASARFMPGAWVFPGGALDPGDGDAGHRAAAVREGAEEGGVEVPDPGALVPFSRWVT